MSPKNYNKKNIAKLVGLMSVSIATTGCMNNVKEANNNAIRGDVIADVKMKEGTSFSEKNTFIHESEGIFVGGEMYKLSERDSLPALFKNEVLFSQPDAIPFADFISLMSDQMGVRVMVSSDALEYLKGSDVYSDDNDDAVSQSEVTADNVVFDRSVRNNQEETELGKSGIKISMEYEGDLEGMLDVLSAKANLYWRWENNRVILYRTISKTFILDTLSGKTSFESTVNSSSITSAKSDADIGTAGSTDNSTKHQVSFVSNPDSPWEAVKESIKAMLTEDGKVAFGEQTGTITVTDTPSSLERVEEYMKQINHILSQRIAVKTEIFDVVIDDNDDFGADMEALFSGSNDLSFKFNSGFNNSGNFEFGIISPTSDWSGSQAFINALQKQVRTSEVNTNQVFTTNGVPVPLQIVDTEGYVKETSVETTDSGSSTELVPGTISTGLNMALVPKKMSNGDIMLHMSLDMSSLNDIRTVKTSDGTSIIEFPQTSAKTFSQRIAVRSGETLMISGFEKTRDNAEGSNILGKSLWALGGKKSGGTLRTKTIVLITPISVAR